MAEIPAPIIVYGAKRERARIVTFKVPPDELAIIDALAAEHGMTRSELIRAAIHYYMREVLGYRETLKNPS